MGGPHGIVGLVLPPPTRWRRRNVFAKWFLSVFVLNITRACVAGSAVQRICVTCPVSDSCFKTSWKNFLIVASVVSGGIHWLLLVWILLRLLRSVSRVSPA